MSQICLIEERKYSKNITIFHNLEYNFQHIKVLLSNLAPCCDKMLKEDYYLFLLQSHSTSALAKSSTPGDEVDPGINITTRCQGGPVMATSK